MKKIIALLLALMMVIGMVACGGKKEAPKDAPETDVEAPVENEGETETETETPAVNVYKLGGVGPLTGGAAIYGNAAANGAKIAVDEINALGGDIQFELDYQDDAHDAEKSVNAYNSLKDWGMQIFLGSVTSAPGVATSVEANNDNIFYLTPSASSTDVLGGVANPLTNSVDIERKANVFQLCFMDPNQGSASAQYISDKALGENIAVIYKNDDVYSVGIYNSFAAKAEELGLNIVSTTTFTTDSQTDFSVQIADAKDNGADLVFLPMYYDAASLILTQADAVGYAPTFFGVDGMDGILTVEGFDTALAEGVILLTPFSADAQDDATVNFVTKYQEAYGEIPNQFAADAYDCVYAIYAALQASGATADMSASELCDLLVATFTSADFSVDGLTGAGMTWDTTGAVNKTPKGMVIEGGVYVGLD